MPTKPVLPITEIDFFRVKNQLKEFLRNDPQSRFQDFDFEGSNISVFLDVLAYNTYQNNFYTNMAISEMFLDSAQLNNSVVSHAKELNYLPRSDVSSRAVVNLTLQDPDNESSVIPIPSGTRFSARQGNDQYNFYTDRSYLARRITPNGTYEIRDVDIYEGDLIEEGFISSVGKNTYKLLNQNIDVSSIRVYEIDQSSDSRIEYIFRKDIFGVTSDDNVFFVEPGFDETYEIVFGNNRFGRVPPAGSRILVTYRITNGSSANGACRFTTSSVKRSQESTINVTVTVTTVASAFGGADRETIEDIKFFAPKSIQVQERAVTESDYEVLLKQRFNEIQDISVFGGDELDPPRFGKVAIAVNVEGGLSDVAAKKYESFIKDKTPIGIQPILIPPEFMYVDVNINVVYEFGITSQTPDDIEKEIRQALSEYSSNNLSKFGSSFEVSRVSAIIDSINPAIRNTTVEALPYILYSPAFGRKETPTFVFDTEFGSSSIFARANRNDSSFSSFVRSSPFIFNGTEAIFEDSGAKNVDGLGVIDIINLKDRNVGRFEVLRGGRRKGTVNYSKGIVKLIDIIVDSYEGPGIKIIANTKDFNVTAPKNRVLMLKDEDVRITIREVRRK
jgi:hypothetical protein